MNMFLDRSIDVVSRLPVLADTLMTPTRLAASELALIVGGGKGAGLCEFVAVANVGLSFAGLFGCIACSAASLVVSLGIFIAC